MHVNFYERSVLVKGLYSDNKLEEIQSGYKAGKKQSRVKNSSSGQKQFIRVKTVQGKIQSRCQSGSRLSELKVGKNSSSVTPRVVPSTVLGSSSV